MSSAESIKRAMAACENGIKALEARVKTNGELVKARDTEYNTWRSRKDAAEEKWNRENSDRQNAQNEWERRVKDKAEEKRGEQRRWNNCTPTWDADAGKHDDWCRNDIGDGWYHAGKECGKGPCGFWNQGSCKGICKKDDGLRRREAEKEIGARPANYNEPRFSQQEPGQAQLDTTPITVGCCANQTNIIGSELKDSTINQQNNCLSNMQNEYDKKKAEEKAAADKAAADKAAADKAAANKAAADKVAAAAPKPASSAALTSSPSAPAATGTSTSVSIDKTDENKKMVLIIAAILAVICCSVVLLVVFMMII